MNEIPKRVLTALICVALSLIFKGYNIYTLSFYYTTIVVMCLFEYHYKINSTRKKITILLSTIIYCIMVGNLLDIIDKRYISITLPVMMSLFSVELFSGKENPMLSIGTDLIGIVWICMPLFLCNLLSYPYSETVGGRVHDPRIVYGVMIFVFSTDVGAYFFGRFLGKHKLCPSISPKKTWEGSIGGGITSTVVYYCIKGYFTILTDDAWFVIMIIAVVAGSIGDLIESMFKRDLGIKDMGTILGNHGGTLDRVDSLLYAVPFIYSYLVVTGNFN